MTLYITGLNGSVSNGLGRCLLENKLISDFIELDSAFLSKDFEQQVSLIKDKVAKSDKVIACSYGAYLLLNSLQESTNLSKDFLLISPVLGMAMVPNGGRLPRNLSNFKRRINSKELKLPDKVKIISGGKDEIAPVSNIDFLCSNYLQINIEISEACDHSLNHKFVIEHVLNFLKSK